MKPPGYESENLGRGDIEPLRIIDEAQQRPLLGNLGEQAQHSQSDKKAVGGIAGREAEGHAQRGLLGFGKRVQLREHRSTQVMESRERQFHLALHARDLGHSEPSSLPGCVPDERRLANPGLPPYEQDRTLAPTRSFK